MARRNLSGVLAAKSGSVRVYRGSHKRVKRVTLCGNWSSDLLVVALAIFLTLLLRIPSLARTAADSH
jgi:hypothetical protein